ncbi:MAG: phosphonopyruvate decarboxylase, partial [Thermoanaerobaculia bacterium]
MIEARSFVEAAKGRGITVWSGVPCSYLQPFINHVLSDGSLEYVPASNEGDAVAVAAGVEVGGGRAVAMFQNSGLGNAVNPLTSLAQTHRIPLLMIATLRGEPGGAPDEPQHALMGSITGRLLDLMGIRTEAFPTREEDVLPCLERAMSWWETDGTPYCLLMRKGSVEPAPAPPLPEARSLEGRRSDRLPGPASASRAEMLTAVQAATGGRDVVLATTGYTGRELYACADRPNQLYLVGAMGCASSVGLGLAIQRPDLRVIVLDGDGAALMRLGALAAIGYRRPPNLVHIVLDNGMHESTGGQATVSPSVDLAGIAADCGYPDTRVLTDPAELARLLKSGTSRLTFVRALITPGVGRNLPRPALPPPAATDRFRAHLRDLARARP